jgi:hypothetical protein
VCRRCLRPGACWLTSQNSSHQLALFAAVERRRPARIRPAWGDDPLLAKYVRVVETVSHLVGQGFALSPSDRLCRTPLWSGMVVKLPPREQERGRGQVDTCAAFSGWTWPLPFSVKRLLLVHLIWIDTYAAHETVSFFNYEVAVVVVEGNDPPVKKALLAKHASE